MTSIRDSYLELMKKVLLNEVYLAHEPSNVDEAARWSARQEGRDVPGFGLTMVGRKRLDNVHRCVASVLEEEIPGDLMECGVWRGGVAILMRAVLRAYSVSDRTVWLADSFRGVPPPKEHLYPADAGQQLHNLPELAIPRSEVERNFARFDLLDRQVQVIEGFFADTLPRAPVGRLALLRLDGDLYESTYVALESLYRRVSPGGFVLVDDYNCYECCRRAVHDFEQERGLTFDIQPVDWTGVYWRKALGADGETSPAGIVVTGWNPPEMGKVEQLPGTAVEVSETPSHALFDAAFYLRTYPDVAAAGVDPYSHFVQAGIAERRDPHPLFRTAFYLQNCAEATAEGTNPLDHYAETGAAQGCNPHPLFDTRFYARQAKLNPGENPLLHYCTEGSNAGLAPHPLIDPPMILGQLPEIADGRNLLTGFLSLHGSSAPRPHVLFDVALYLRENPDVAAEPINPLLHYVLYGWREDRRPHVLFDHAFYLSQAGDTGTCPLQHYEREGSGRGLSPHPWFNAPFYLREHPEIAGGSESALAHYLRNGFRRGYNPSPWFDGAVYLAQCEAAPPEDVSPLEHAVDRGDCEQLCRIVRNRLAQSVRSNRDTLQTPAAPKLIAFYLPRYYPIPENDRWWGKGFTDWLNVVRAVPMFEGHYQPRTPADLGFYDLRLPEILDQQAELASSYGVHGFCFYHYWFDGQTLLERPLLEMLARRSPRWPFCICWANEDWSRNRHGRPQDALMQQKYSSGFAERFLRDALPILTASGYIQVGGAPLLLVQRPDRIPDCRRTTYTWRRLFRECTGLELHLSAIENQGLGDPRDLGFDSAVEFGPRYRSPSLPGENLRRIRPDFVGSVEDYRALVRRALTRASAEYPLFRGVMPGFDDTARWGLNSRIVTGGSPGDYRNWLRAATTVSLAANSIVDPLIFLSAWNDWAQGAYLEPDRQFGHAYLEATKAGLSDGIEDFGALGGSATGSGC